MYQANGKWDKKDIFFAELNNFSSSLHDTFEDAEKMCDKAEQSGFNGEGKIFPLATWVTFQLDDYSKHYCPFCLNKLPVNGSHWDCCDEYEADDCLPKYFPLTEAKMLEIRIGNIKQANKIRNKAIRESKTRQAEYEKRLELLTN